MQNEGIAMFIDQIRSISRLQPPMTQLYINNAAIEFIEVDSDS